MKKTLIVIGLALALIGAAGGEVHHHQWVIYRTKGYGGYPGTHSPYEYFVTCQVICAECVTIKDLPHDEAEK